MHHARQRSRLGKARIAALVEVGYRAASTPGLAGATSAIAALTEIVPAQAYDLVSVDPASRQHRTVATQGYQRGAAAAVTNLEYPRTESFRRLTERRCPVWIGEPESRFAETTYFQDYLAPEGWRDGITAPLYQVDGRLSGLLHLNAKEAGTFDEGTGEVLEVVSSVLAHVTDALGVVAPSAIPNDCRSLAFDADGDVRSVPGWERSEAIASDPGLVGVARSFLVSGEQQSRRAWRDRGGQWRDLHLARTTPATGQGILAVLAERPRRIPYGLTVREVEVLALVAQGESNQTIADMLVLSTRTVTTHLQNIFAKLGCESRLRAAAIAQREGLARVELSR